jgi:hypothetical protein
MSPGSGSVSVRSIRLPLALGWKSPSGPPPPPPPLLSEKSPLGS